MRSFQDFNRRTFLKTSSAAVLAASYPRAGRAQSSKVLRFVPAVDLANPDPVWSTAQVTANHAYMVWDTLYGIDNAFVPQPQMCRSHTISADKLNWEFSLREGLFFHDGEPVRASDCVESIKRWAPKNPFGARLLSQMESITTLDEARFQIKLAKPFGQMLYALGSQRCFIMPERIAKTSPNEIIKEFIGSGPFRFIPKEWRLGVGAAYEKFTGYVPRKESPEWYAGGKIANFDHVEWITQPDPASAVAALQTGSVDWLESPLLDLLPLLQSDKSVSVSTFDDLGVLAMAVVNHLNPPFDNPAILRAILSATNQMDCVTAVVGTQTDLASVPVGFFANGTQLASDAGMAALAKPAAVEQAKAAIAKAGYAGERIVFMAASDQPALMAISQVTNGLWQQLGLNVDFQVMDWATLVARRAKQDPIEQGGWSTWCTWWPGLAMSNPGSAYPLQAIGKKGWIGWYENQKLVEAQARWFDASDTNAEKAIGREIQDLAFEEPPFIPLGQWKQPRAFKAGLKNFVRCSDTLFWGVDQAG